MNFTKNITLQKSKQLKADLTATRGIKSEICKVDTLLVRTNYQVILEKKDLGIRNKKFKPKYYKIYIDDIGRWVVRSKYIIDVSHLKEKFEMIERSKT